MTAWIVFGCFCLVLFGVLIKTFWSPPSPDTDKRLDDHSGVDPRI